MRFEIIKSSYGLVIDDLTLYIGKDINNNMTNELTTEDFCAISSLLGVEAHDMYYITPNQKVWLFEQKYRPDKKPQKTLIDPIDLGDIKGALYSWYMRAFIFEEKEKDPAVHREVLVHKFAADDNRSYQELFSEEFLGYCKFYKTATGYSLYNYVDYFGLTMHFDEQGRFHSEYEPAYSDHGVDWEFSIYAKHGRFVEHMPSVRCPCISKFLYVSGEVTDYRIPTDIIDFIEDHDGTHAEYLHVRKFPDLNGIYYAIGDYDEDEELDDFLVLCDTRSGQPQPIKVF